VSDQGGVLPGLWPIHGEGVLARQGDLVLLVHPAGGAFTDRLLDLLARTARAGASAGRFADLVSAECEANAAAAGGDDEGPAAVAFGPAVGGTAFTVYGTAWAEVTTARGVQRLGTGEPYGRLTYVLPSTLIKVRAGVQPPSSVGDTDPYLRLADGVVRAVAFVYAPAEVPPETEPAAATAPPVAAPAPAPVEAPAEEQFPAGTEPPGDAAPSIGAVVAGGGAAAGGAAVAGLAEAPEAPEASEAPDVAGPPDLPSATSLDAGWRDQAPAPAPVEPDQDPMPSPTSLDAAWSDQVAPPAPVEPDQPPVHIPTSLDVSWRDQVPPPGPAPVDAGFGEPFGAGPQAAGDPYAQAAYPYDAAPGDQADFVSLPLGGQPAEEMPRRDPLPLGAEPLGDQALSPAEGLAPIVMGIYCKNGHFDDPEARFCAVCGIGMAQLTKVPQEGRRPPLGVLILDDGSVCQLDTDYVVGREPTLDKSVAEGRARPLRLGGAPDLVSRIHARVELDGWEVFVSDLNSANGTLLVLPGETTGTKLAPGVRTPLVAGAQIRLGDAYALRYDSHRHR
jgi:FHA domain-containing protein